MNAREVGGLIRYWFETSMQRVGYLYGYYAEDPTYEDGVRAVVEAIYEPPQQNDLNSSIILPDQLQMNVEKIAGRLGLQRIGYIFSTYNTDVFLTAEEVRLTSGDADRQVPRGLQGEAPDRSRRLEADSDGPAPRREEGRRGHPRSVHDFGPVPVAGARPAAAAARGPQVPPTQGDRGVALTAERTSCPSSSTRAATPTKSSPISSS